MQEIHRTKQTLLTMAAHSLTHKPAQQRDRAWQKETPFSSLSQGIPACWTGEQGQLQDMRHNSRHAQARLHHATPLTAGAAATVAAADEMRS
jgi:hypothetical protein